MLLIESIYPLLLRRVSSFSPIRPYPLQNHSIFTFPSRYLFSTRPDNGRQLKDRNFQQYSRASPIYWSTTVFVSTCGSVFDVCAISCFFGRLAPANYLSRLLSQWKMVSTAAFSQAPLTQAHYTLRPAYPVIHVSEHF